MTGIVDLVQLTVAIGAQLETVSELIDPYLDLQAEHRGEVARYGHSWPGAVAQIANAAAALRAAEETLWDLLATRDALYPFVGPTYTPDDDEEPF